MDTSTSGSRKEGPNPYDEIEMYLKMAKDDIIAAWASSTTPYSKSLLLPETTGETSIIETCSSPTKSKRTNKHSRYKFDYSPTRCRASPKSPKEKRKTLLCSWKQYSKYGGRRPFKRDPKLQEWSQEILKDFQVLVEEEIKALSVPSTQKKDNLAFDKHYHSSFDVTNSKSVKWSLKDSNVNNSTVHCIDKEVFKVENLVDLNLGQDCHYFDKRSEMGTNQSVLRGSEAWVDDYAPFKTYTLPRSNQRSVSFVGERLPTSSTHPDYTNDNCKLLKITQHRFSRSHSLDEVKGLNPWALQHLRTINEAQQDHRAYPHLQDQDAILTEGIYARIRKSGIRHTDNEKWENAMKSEGKVLKQELEFDERSSNMISKGDCMYSNEYQYLSTESGVREPRRYSVGSCSSALTIEALSRQDNENWHWADDDGVCSITDRICDDMCGHCKKIYSQSENSLLSLKPEIVITPDCSAIDWNNERHFFPETNGHDISVINDSFEDGNWVTSDRQMRSLVGTGRKSEPARPSKPIVPSSPLLGIPGLELRRHTLPNAPNKSADGDLYASLEMPDTPVFNTLSWDTLPPAEEMEIMEIKPIQMKEEKEKKVEGLPPLHFTIPRSKSLSSVRSLNSSLSSLSHISTRDDFSENELWSSYTHLPNGSVTGNVETTEPLLDNDSFSPDVFLDPSDMYSYDRENHFLNGNLDHYTPRWKSNSLKDVFVDTTPIIIKLSPKVFPEDSKRPKTFSVEECQEQNSDSNKINVSNHILTGHSNMLTSTPKEILTEGNTGNATLITKQNKLSSSDMLEPITGVLHLTPLKNDVNSRTEMIFSVNIPERKETSTQCAPDELRFARESNSDSGNIELNQKISKVERPKTTENALIQSSGPDLKEMTENRGVISSKMSKSINSILSELDAHNEAMKIKERSNKHCRKMKEDLVNGEVKLRSKTKKCEKKEKEF